MSTRLNSELRIAIVQALLDHKFLTTKNKHELDRVEFAEAVYNDMYSESDRRLMAKLPKGWLQVHTSFTAHFVGRWERLQLKKERRFAHVCSPKYPSGHDLTTTLFKMQRAETELDEQLRSTHAATMAMLTSCSTIEMLLKRWPEVKPFVPKAAAITTALALPVKELNAMFGLP